MYNGSPRDIKEKLLGSDRDENESRSADSAREYGINKSD